MVTFFRHVWHDLIDDEQVARRVIRGVLLGYAASAATLGIMLAASPLWVRVAVFVTGGLAGLFGGLISVGQMNPPPPAGP